MFGCNLFGLIELFVKSIQTNYIQTQYFRPLHEFEIIVGFVMISCNR